MFRTALVVPTCREKCIQRFLKAWQPLPWDGVVVMEDNAHKQFAIGDQLSQANHLHLAHDDIPKSHQGLFFTNNSAIRCWGFYRAVHEFDVDYIFTLDDDCLPDTSNGESAATAFVDAHLRQLTATPQVVPTIDQHHPRGYPFRSHGNLGSQVVANMGLWTCHPDLSAVYEVARPRVHGYTPPPGSVVMPASQYWPMCGMNLVFQAEFAALFYFAPMVERTPYDRYEDIWCGYLAQRVAREAGLSFTVGEPFVQHVRASNPFVNLRKEASGLHVNEWIWRLIDALDLRPTTVPSSPLAAVRESLQLFANAVHKQEWGRFEQDSYFRFLQEDEQVQAYLEQWATNVLRWMELLDGDR